MGKGKNQKKRKQENDDNSKMQSVCILSYAARRLQMDNIINKELAGLFEIAPVEKKVLKEVLSFYLPGLYLCKSEQRTEHIKLIITLNRIRNYISDNSTDALSSAMLGTVFAPGQIRKTQRDFLQWAKKLQGDELLLMGYKLHLDKVVLAFHRACPAETEILSLAYYYCLLGLEQFITPAMLAELNEYLFLDCDTPKDFFDFFAGLYRSLIIARMELFTLDEAPQCNISDLTGNDKKLSDLFKRGNYNRQPKGKISHTISPSDVISAVARDCGLPVIEFVAELLTSKKDKSATACIVDSYVSCFSGSDSNRDDISLTDDSILSLSSVLSTDAMGKIAGLNRAYTEHLDPFRVSKIYPGISDSGIVKDADKPLTEADTYLRQTNYEYALFCRLMINKYISEIKSQVETSMLKKDGSGPKKSNDSSVVASLSKSLAEYKEENRRLKENNDKLYSNLMSLKNREAAIIGRYENLEREYLKLRDKYEQYADESEEMDTPDIQETTEEIEETAKFLNNAEIPDDYSKQLSECFKNKKVIIVGGHVNLNNKFSLAYPDVSILRMDRIATCDAAIKGADAVLFKSNYIGHGLYKKTKTLAQKNKIPFGYIDNVNSVENMAKSIYLELVRILSFAE